jgi:Flp pilus assembly protein TadB
LSLEKTESLLKKFDYTYKKTNDQIEVRLGLGLEVTASFSETGKVILKDELTTWNFLTGTLDMSLKRAIIINFLAPVFFIGLFTYTLGDDYLLVMIIAFLMIFWVLLWSNYYIIRAEHMKQTLRRWNEN